MATGEPTKEDLIRWIHAVEAGKAKRIGGLIVELYFARRLREQHVNGTYADGWLYVRSDSVEEARDWFRIFPGSLELGSAELEFIELLQSRGHRFFAVTAKLGSEQNSGKDAIPRVAVSLSEWSTTEGRFESGTVLSARYEASTRSRLHDYLSSVDFHLGYSEENPFPFRSWLETREASELADLLLRRCIMNGGLALPVDLDALLIDEGGALRFNEMKRKDPAAGAYCYSSADSRPHDLVKNADEIERKLRSSVKDEKSAMRLFEEECRLRGLIRIGKRSFGLDMVHLQTMALCEASGIDYRYVVWDCEPERTTPPDNVNEVLEDLNKVLSPDLLPRHKIEWWSRSLKVSDVAGISYTYGRNSGTYDSGFRSQVTFDRHTQCPVCTANLVIRESKGHYYVRCSECRFVDIKPSRRH